MGIQQMIMAAGGLDAYLVSKSLRFNGDDDAHLSRTFDSGGSVTTWTFSFWIKGSDLAQACYVFTGGTGTNSYITMDVGQFRFTSDAHDLKTNARYRDPAAWYHFVCVANTTESSANDRTTVYVNGTQLVAADFATHNQPNGSDDLGDFGSAAVHYINRLTTGSQQDFMLADIHFIDGTALDADSFGETNATTGQWVPKKYSGSYGTNGFYLKFNGTDLGEDSSGQGNDWTANNLTQSIGTGQPKMYKSTTLYTTKADIVANGTEVTGGDSVASNYLYIVTNGASGSDTKVFSSGWNLVGGIPRHWGYNTSTSSWDNLASYGSSEWDSPGIFWSSNSEAYKYFNEGTEFRILCDPDTSSGPAVFSSGTNTAPTLTTSVSEQSTNSIDVSTDTPTPFDDEGNGTGNYCTWNPLCITTTANSLSEGNLKATHAASTAWTGGLGTNGATFSGTIGMTSGKWYFEMNSDGGANLPVFGITNKLDGSNYVGKVGNGIGIVSTAIYNSDFPATSTPSVGTLVDGDIIGIAVDMDNGFVWFSINGTWQNSGDPTDTDGASNGCCGDGFVGETMFPACSQVGRDHGIIVTANFGQRAFAYTPPTGFKALNTFNLDDPLIADPSKHFDLAIDDGADILSTANGLTDGADFVWIKRRAGNDHHILFNRINDPEMDGTPNLKSNDGHSEDGCGTYSAPSGDSVAWVWNAGTANVTNDASATGVGSIDSTYRANTDAGFSIVTYTGNNTDPASVAHGLNAKPALILVKNRDTASTSWVMYHKVHGATKYMYLNDNIAATASADAWDDTEPTSTVWTMQDWSYMNNTDNFVAYVWSEVEGYSKFSEYTGNGSTDGPFVYTGFKPAFIIVKRHNNAQAWWMFDSVRPSSHSLYPQEQNGEDDKGHTFDFLSNGFKLRSDEDEVNVDTKPYMYIAFASHPFKYANAQPIEID